MLNNNRTISMAQATVPNPNWGTANSTRLGFDGSAKPIAKRYLAGGINGTTHAYNDTTPVVGFTTQYDLSGNKIFERELHAKTRSHLYQPFDVNGVPLGGYDSVDRLRKALRGELSSDGGYTATGGGSITTPIALANTDTSRDYDLDGLGNWIQSDYIPVGGTATIDLRQHNKLNEITSRKVGDDTKVLFVYDGTSGASNGNLADDGTLMLSYDAFNRLIQVNRKSDGATIGQYVYDALNRRVSKTISNGGLTEDIPNGTTNYLYQNWQVMEERNGSDTTIKQYVWGQYIDECIQLKTLTTTGPGSLLAGDYYPLQDLLYRTIALTDDDGDIVEAYDYDAYGNTLIFSAAGTGDNWWTDDATQANYAACEVLFCGYRYDPESKLYQVRNREYYPALGRWLQRDPIGFDGNDWNLYGFVENQAVNAIDGYGLDKITSNYRDPIYDPYHGGPPPTRKWPSPPPKLPPNIHFGAGENWDPNMTNPGIMGVTYGNQSYFGPSWLARTPTVRVSIRVHERAHRQQPWYMKNPWTRENDAYTKEKNWLVQTMNRKWPGWQKNDSKYANCDDYNDSYFRLQEIDQELNKPFWYGP